MQDASFFSKKAVPSAGSNTNFDAWDLGDRGSVSGVYANTTEMQLSIKWPAMAALADTKSLTWVLYHCDTSGGTYTDSGIRHSVTGAGGAGVSAGQVRLALNPETKRFIKLNQALEASGGSITADVDAAIEFKY